jgi:cobalt-precorrin 5A hydrolase
VYVFAKKNHLAIGSMRDAKKIAAAILRGERVGVCCSGAAGGSIEGRIPPELILLNGNGQQEPDADQENTADSQNLNAKCVPEKCDSGKCDPGKYFPEKKVQHLIWISERLPGREAEQYLEDTGGTILHLIPRTVILGIGCRKGKMQEEIVRAAAQVLQEESISEKALVMAASIDLKKEEIGILGMCEQYEIPFVTYSAQQLAQVQGEFQSSEFVRKTTGVDNVCERSSLLAAGDGGRLIRKKYAENGVTAALAARKWRVRFEE